MAAAAESAGVLLYRVGEGGPEVLLAHPGGPFWARKDAGAWTIPKGGFDEGEAPRDAALRELAEELGPAAPRIAAGALVELGSIRQKGGKVVHAWTTEADFDPARLDSNVFSIEWPPRSGAEREFPEVDRVAWFEPAEAREKILPAQAPLVDRLLERLGRATL